MVPGGLQNRRAERASLDFSQNTWLESSSLDGCSVIQAAVAGMSAGQLARRFLLKVLQLSNRPD